LQLVVVTCVSVISAQCDGSCQNTTMFCPSPYRPSLCPGPQNIQCCPEVTPYCPGQCQTTYLPCTYGTYVHNLCPGPSTVLCCKGGVTFAERYWNCEDVKCKYLVGAGAIQPNYASAEFVSRSLAAEGYVFGLSGLEEKGFFAVYTFNNVTYDLLWVSQLQASGSPKGLREYLISIGWSVTNTINLLSAVFISDANGPFSRVAIGVGSDLCDAHDPAIYHVYPCSKVLSVIEVLNPPA